MTTGLLLRRSKAGRQSSGDCALITLCATTMDGSLTTRRLRLFRIRACEQIENGAQAENGAASLGFNRSTVFGWYAAYRKGGVEALRAKPVPGRPPKLTPAQMNMLYTMIAGSNPDQFQLEFNLWTRDLVRQVIAKRFGVNFRSARSGASCEGSACHRRGRCTGHTSRTPSGWTAGARRSSQRSELKRRSSEPPGTSPTRPESVPTTTPARRGRPSGEPPSYGPPAPGTRST